MALQKTVNGVHSVRVNEQRSHFAIATENGVKIFSIDPLTLVGELSKQEVGSCKVAELYFDSDVIALVGGGSAPKFDEKTVLMVHVQKKTLMVEITLDGVVLAVRFTKKRLIVILAEKICIFRYENGEKLHEIKTGFNYKGLCEVSNNGIMVLPSPAKGHVQVVDLGLLKDGSTVSPVIISAHQGEIACLGIINNGSMVATASDKGTLTRVYSIATKKKELELRRGCDSAIVYSISFSPCDEFISVCSDKGTLHVFAVKDPSLNKTTMFSQVGTLLPSNLGKPFEEQKSMARVTIQEECPSTLTYLGNQIIAAISIDGTFQKFAVQQGQCKLRLSAYALDLGDDFE